MSTTGPFTVLMFSTKVTGGQWFDLTGKAQGLRFRETAPGGFHSATFTIPKTIASVVDDDPFNRILVVDKRNRRTAWEGRIEDLGRNADAGGEWREYTVVGSGGWAGAITRPYVMLDQDLGSWEIQKSVGSASYLRAERSTDPDTQEEALVFSAGQGATSTVGDIIRARYTGLREAGQLFGGITYTADSGRVNTAMAVEFRYPQGTVLQTNTQSSTAATRSQRVTTDFAVGLVASQPQLDLVVATAETPIGAGANSWSSVYDICVKALRLNKDGTQNTTGADYAGTTVTSDVIVADLLGRWGTDLYDGANATISTGVYGIDQWCYLDGVSMADQLNDLMALEPGYYWQARESSLLRGGSSACRFKWAFWPTAHRYLAEGAVITAPLSYADVFSEVNVRWRTPRGHTHYVTATQSIPGLVGVRAATIDLSDEIGSVAAANQLATQFLAEHRLPSNQGSVTLSRPVFDTFRSGWVMPWEVETGQLVTLSGITPSVDTLNQTDRDAVTTFRIVGKDVDDSGVTTLELDSYPRVVAQALKRMARRARKR